MAKLTYDEARIIFNYNPDTGRVSWLSRPLGMFISDAYGRFWNARNAGRPALSKRARSGHLWGYFQGKAYKSHRVAWLLFHGSWPSGEIDHIDGNPANNSIENLRDVSRSINQRNARRRVDNTSGTTGVYLASNKWVATIWTDGSRKILGRFREKSEAIAARVAAEAAYGYTDRHGT